MHVYLKNFLKYCFGQLFCSSICQVANANEAKQTGGIWRPSRISFPLRAAQQKISRPPLLMLRNDRPSQFNPVGSGGEQQQPQQQQFNNQRPHYNPVRQLQPLFFRNNNNNNKNSRFPFNRPTAPDHYQQQPSSQQSKTCTTL